jgi:Zn-dependent protease with chaperone function
MASRPKPQSETVSIGSISRQTDADADVPATRQELEAQLLEALNFKIPYQAPSLLYRFTSLLSLGTLCLTPFIYFGLITLIAHTLWWNIRYCIADGKIEDHLQQLILTSGLCFLAILFLLKPLVLLLWFADDKSKQRKLSRKTEPFIFEYIEAICHSVDAPVPTLIRIDFNSNAAAGLRYPLRALFNNELVLVIGMPFISGMTLRQLTGVLAHEFGHFSQHAGMRINVWNRILNHVLLYVIHSRDKLDDWLTHMTYVPLREFKILVWVAIFIVATSRRTLMAVFWIVEIVSNYYSRQMEFDADRYEYRLVGAEIFEATSHHLAELSVARDQAFSELRMHYEEGRLPDDLPALIAHQALTIDPKIKEVLTQQAADARTRLFDSHPCHRERIACAHETGETGAIRFKPYMNSLPASVLFRDYKKMCRAATMDLYKTHLGDEFKKSSVVPADEVISRSVAQVESFETSRRFYMTELDHLRPIQLDESPTVMPENPVETFQQLKLAREQMLNLVCDYETYAQAYSYAEGNNIRLTNALLLVEYGIKFSFRELGLPSANKKAIKQRKDEVKTALQHLNSQMAPYEEAMTKRLLLALSLLHLPKVRQRMNTDKNQLKLLKQMLHTIQFMNEQIEGLQPMRLINQRIQVLAAHIVDDETMKQKYGSELHELLGKMDFQMKRIQTDLGDEIYPLDHQDKEMTLRAFIFGEIQDWQVLGPRYLLDSAGNIYLKMIHVQRRLYFQLAVLAENIESAMGLEPLEKPKAVSKESTKTRSASSKRKQLRQ